jgi:hypothetical protein
LNGTHTAPHRTAPHEDSLVWLNGVFHGSFMYLVTAMSVLSIWLADCTLIMI